MNNQSWATFRWVAANCIKHGSDVPAIDFQYFLHSLKWVRTFLVLMFWGRLRGCPLTASRQLVGERRASVTPPFLGHSPCGASSDVPKESCLVVLGDVASGHYQTTNTLKCLHAGLGLRLSVTSFTCGFAPFPSLHSLVASWTWICPFSLRNEVFR